MSQDGADLNMDAEGAMKAALGGDQPDRMSDEAFERMIRSASVESRGYGGCANRAARLVLEYLERHPDQVASSDHAFYEQLKTEVGDEDREQVLSELTGFMWGWAVNAARHILKQQPVPNPAIVEIDTGK